MSRRFTGKHITIILVAGFGVVVAVNLLMATLAARNFGGVVVDSSYVASQHFNSWLDEAERDRALGWSASVERTRGGKLELRTSGVPADAQISASLRRPIGVDEHEDLEFERIASDYYVSLQAAETGRWIVRLAINSGQDSWASEAMIE